MSKYFVGDFKIGVACFSVGDRIIASGDACGGQSQRLGRVSSVHKKICITWDNGHFGEYTLKQMQAWNYQKFLEDEIQEPECNSHNLTSAQESARDSALQVCNSDLNLLAPQKLTPIAQTSLQRDTQVYTTTAMCEKSQIVQNVDLGTTCTQEELALLQPVPLVPHSPQKANGLEVQTSVIAFPPSSKLLENCSQTSQLSKTSQDSLPAPTIQDNQQVHISKAWSAPLTASGTMRNGLLSAVDTLPVPSLESEYCWLRSPGALSSTGKGRPPGQTKQEAELKELGLINKGEVLNPAILCQWYEIPETWLDPLESRAATELLEINAQQQEIFSILDLLRSPYSESSTSIPCVENKQLQQFKAITLHQPWAYLVGRYKWFETRDWPTNYRGKIAIHAAQKKDDIDYWYSLLNDLLPPIEELIFGAIVAIADLTNCILMTEEFINQQSPTELRCGNWKAGCYAWKLENIHILTEPIPAKGKQRLWNIELPGALAQTTPDIAPQSLVTKFLEDKSGTQEPLILCPSCGSQHIYLSGGCGICGLEPIECTQQLQVDGKSSSGDRLKDDLGENELSQPTPENSIEENQEAVAPAQQTKPSKQKGCLYKYLENKKLKNGSIVSYPRIIEDKRDPDKPQHWRWGFNWEEKIDGEWKGRSIGSIPVGAIAMIKSMQNQGVALEEIIAFIKKSKAKK